MATRHTTITVQFRHRYPDAAAQYIFARGHLYPDPIVRQDRRGICGHHFHLLQEGPVHLPRLEVHEGRHVGVQEVGFIVAQEWGHLDRCLVLGKTFYVILSKKPIAI